jgi:hypothetical protein
MPIVVIGGDLDRFEGLRVSLTFTRPFNWRPAVDAIKELMSLEAS